MDNYIIAIHQYPASPVIAFHAQKILALFRAQAQNTISQALGMPAGTGRDNNHGIGYGIAVIKYVNERVCGFLVCKKTGQSGQPIPQTMLV